jgi:hypothetical protein
MPTTCHGSPLAGVGNDQQIAGGFGWPGIGGCRPSLIGTLGDSASGPIFNGERLPAVDAESGTWA